MHLYRRIRKRKKGQEGSKEEQDIDNLKGQTILHVVVLIRLSSSLWSRNYRS